MRTEAIVTVGAHVAKELHEQKIEQPEQLTKIDRKRVGEGKDVDHG